MRRTKEPPVFSQRQAAWDLVLDCMENQLVFIDVHSTDSASQIRKFIRLATKAREASTRSTAGITIERDMGEPFVVVSVSALGRDRPLASLVLPICPFWRVAHEKYLETMVPIPDDREQIIEEDEWL
jgi:hypothetical protein